MSKTLIAMSGGVDSSVSAALMVREGHECVGVNMKLHNGSVEDDAGSKTCCSLTDAEVETYLQKYAEPEIIPQHEVQQDMGWIFYSF